MRPAPHWTPTDLDWHAAAGSVRLAITYGWAIFAHPTEPRGNLVAMSLDVIGDNGPIVFDTGAAALDDLTF